MELRAADAPVALVLIFPGVLLAPPPVPHHAPPVAGKVHGVVIELLVGLVLAAHARRHFSLRHHGGLVHDEHTGQGVGAVHQRGRPFQYLYGVYVLGVDLYAVLVTPLLPLLAYAVVDGDNAVVAQAADDGLRDAAARGDLADAGLTRDGIDDVGRRRLLQRAGADDAHGRRRAVGQRLAGESRHHHLAEHGIVLAQHKVAGRRGVQVDGLYDGLVAHEAHLDSGFYYWQTVNDVATLGIGHGADFQHGEINTGPDHGPAVNGIGHLSAQHGVAG